MLIVGYGFGGIVACRRYLDTHAVAGPARQAYISVPVNTVALIGPTVGVIVPFGGFLRATLVIETGGVWATGHDSGRPLLDIGNVNVEILDQFVHVDASVRFQVAIEIVECLLG